MQGAGTMLSCAEPCSAMQGVCRTMWGVCPIINVYPKKPLLLSMGYPSKTEVMLVRWQSCNLFKGTFTFGLTETYWWGTRSGIIPTIVKEMTKFIEVVWFRMTLFIGMCIYGIFILCLCTWHHLNWGKLGSYIPTAAFFSGCGFRQGFFSSNIGSNFLWWMNLIPFCCH